MAAILNSAILVSAILVFPLKVTHTCQDRFPLFAQKKTFTHSFWLNLMMAAILNSAMLDSDTAILDSDTLLSSLRLTQKHSPSTLTLTQIILTIWLTRWWQPSWIQPCCTKLWLNLIQSDSNWFILNELDDGSHLELCHLGFSHFAQKKTSLIHSDSTWWWQPSWILPSWIHPFCTKKTSLIHSDSTWWWQPSWTLPSWIQPFCTKKLHSFILTQLDDGSHLELCHHGFTYFAQKKLHSFILTQLDDGSHPELCYLGFRHCHLGFRHLVIFSQINSKNTLTPFWPWLKLIQSD